MHAPHKQSRLGGVNVDQGTLFSQGIGGASDATQLPLEWEAKPACMQSKVSKACLASTKNNASVL